MYNWYAVLVSWNDRLEPYQIEWDPMNKRWIGEYSGRIIYRSPYPMQSSHESYNYAVGNKNVRSCPDKWTMEEVIQ